MPGLNTYAHAAIVTRSGPNAGAPDRYLQLTPAGATCWVDDPEAATAFESMREATRAATRLPAVLRAFGVPQSCEHPARGDMH